MVVLVQPPLQFFDTFDVWRTHWRGHHYPVINMRAVNLCKPVKHAPYVIVTTLPDQADTMSAEIASLKDTSSQRSLIDVTAVANPFNIAHNASSWRV